MRSMLARDAIYPKHGPSWITLLEASNCGSKPFIPTSRQIDVLVSKDN
jgi:hypothetical protein